MTNLIKNIILYDALGNVTGYVEIRPMIDKTFLRVKHSLNTKNLLFSLVINGSNKVYQTKTSETQIVVAGAIDLNYEVFACLVQPIGDQMVSLCSGAINLGKLKNRAAVLEINQAMQELCRIDSCEQGQCNQCPYREYFFKQA